MKNADALDFESFSVFNLKLRVTDRLGRPSSLSSTATFVINVINVNDNTPEFTEKAYNKTIVESKPVNAFVLTVVAKDGDAGAFGEIVYSITAGNSDNTFRIDEVR